MKDLIIGLGEVGGPLREYLGIEGHDLTAPTAYRGPVDTLHIAFRYSKDFVDIVKEYQDQWEAHLTIVHSTVPIGTTRQIPGAVHSPVNGRHATMAHSLRRVPKWIGGERWEEAERVLQRAGFTCISRPEPETTEALKLLCLAKYGAVNALARIAGDLDIDREDMILWDEMYNADVPVALRRPLLIPDGPRIGGHCVVPGVEMLNEQFPHPLLQGILLYG